MTKCNMTAKHVSTFKLGRVGNSNASKITSQIFTDNICHKTIILTNMDHIDSESTQCDKTSTEEASKNFSWINITRGVAQLLWFKWKLQKWRNVQPSQIINRFSRTIYNQQWQMDGEILLKIRQLNDSPYLWQGDFNYKSTNFLKQIQKLPIDVLPHKVWHFHIIYFLDTRTSMLVNHFPAYVKTCTITTS